MQANNLLIRKIVIWDKVFYLFCKFCTFLITGVISFFFLYIFFQGIYGFIYYGPKKIFFSTAFDLTDNNGGVGFFPPLFITLLISFFVAIISIPFSIKLAAWIAFVCGPKKRKLITFLIQLLSFFPSIVFGLFVRKYISAILKTVFGINDSLNILLTIWMFIFMCVPSAVSLMIASLKKNKEIIIASLSLGANLQESIYKLSIPNIKKTILISITVIFNKVISESVALTFLLGNENYDQIFRGDFLDIIMSKLNPLATLISENFFNEGSSTHGKQLLFCFAFLLLIISAFINNLILLIGKSENERNFLDKKITFLFLTIKRVLIIKPVQIICFLWTKNKINENEINLFNFKNLIYEKYDKKFVLKRKNFYCKYITIDKLLRFKLKHNLRKKIYLFWNKFWEYFCISVLVLFCTIIICVICFQGIYALSQNENPLDIGKDSLLRSLFNTLLIILFSLFVAFPISLLSAAYWSEYKEKSKAKNLFFLLINVANSTPSIIFGMFGLVFFIHNLELSSEGTRGRSLIGAILTTIILITPYLTKRLYISFSSVNSESREASYSLGMSKFTTFWYIVLVINSERIWSAFIQSIAKIIGETASIYLTAGINGSTISHLMYPGLTLTTRIYSNFFENDLTTSTNKMYESAFLTIILMSLIIFFSDYLMPWFKEKRKYPLKIVLQYYAFSTKHFFKKIFFKSNKYFLRK